MGMIACPAQLLDEDAGGWTMRSWSSRRGLTWGNGTEPLPVSVFRKANESIVSVHWMIVVDHLRCSSLKVKKMIPDLIHDAAPAPQFEQQGPTPGLGFVQDT